MRKYLRTKTKKITSLDIAVFFRQLATLISAGVPLVQSCEIIRQSQEKLTMQFLVLSLKQEIETGKNLAASIRQFPHYFDELTYHLIYTGEQSGTLDHMLKRIATNKEKYLALKNQIKQALFYPSLIFFVAIIISIIMLAVVVPRFAELFENMHSNLPAFTKAIITLSYFLRHNMVFTIPILLIVGLLFHYCCSKQQVKKYFDHLLLNTPVIKKIIQKIMLARFARNLAATYKAGVPITEALKTIANSCGNYDYFLAIHSLQTDVLAGKQLHVSMQHHPLFPALSSQMIKIGEESGKLDHMLEKTAELYEKDIDQLIAYLGRLLEPLIMLILGVLIGGLIIAMYLPIFKLGTLI